jgi:hypothetical protein
MLTLHTNGSRNIGPKFVYLFFLLYLIFFINIDYFSALPLLLFKQDYNNIYYIISVNLAFIIPNIRAIKRIGPHNEDIISVLVGSLLGDCHAERLNNGGVRFTFKQSNIHKNYFF